ncbi:MAG: YkgJ family cysteine cluster protein [Verrucomicrobiales bacterium]|nr:YkgJ family cysteine cluster protein [Verrucomicrobiales bacterium]MCP5559096.1 YkgJ family cysteine cluster protein [Verrucomicrobiaceae bacterium]
MIAPEFAAAASRLCLACGMCCNGVLFQIVRLQPGDSVALLEARGLKLRRKKRAPYFDQPCAMLEGCRCTLYSDRPSRCRAFECQQIQRLGLGETSEVEAMAAIVAVRQLVERVRAKLGAVGDVSVGDPLLERCAQSLAAEDVDVAALNALLEAEFRVAAVG